MMGGAGSGIGFYPKSETPRDLNSTIDMFGVALEFTDSEQDGQNNNERVTITSQNPPTEEVTLVDPKNRPNILLHSQSRESLELHTAPPPHGGSIGNLFVGGNQKYTRGNPPILDFRTELLASQFSKKEKLRLVVEHKQAELVALKRTVQFLHRKLEPVILIQQLKQRNDRLQHQCNIMTSQVDACTDGTIPLGETSEEFYRDRSPRPPDTTPILTNQSPSSQLHGGHDGYPVPGPSTRNQIGRLPTGSQQHPNSAPTGRKIAPPRPPPPNSLRIQWECSKCTFRNHPDLTMCEQCEMIRVKPSLAGLNTSPTTPPGAMDQTPPPSYYYSQQYPRSAS